MAKRRMSSASKIGRLNRKGTWSSLGYSSSGKHKHRYAVENARFDAKKMRGMGRRQRHAFAAQMRLERHGRPKRR